MGSPHRSIRKIKELDHKVKVPLTKQYSFVKHMNVNTHVRNVTRGFR